MAEGESVMSDLPLFDVKKDWQKEWVGMPEFTQEKIEPYSSIIIRFETKEDLENFANLIGQRLTKKTKSIWFPFRSHWGKHKEEWIDES